MLRNTEVRLISLSILFLSILDTTAVVVLFGFSIIMQIIVNIFFLSDYLSPNGNVSIVQTNGLLSQSEAENSISSGYS